jgi:hypothetical protein
MTPTDFKSYTDQLIRVALVAAGIALAFYSLGLSYNLQDKTLFTTLATALGLLLVGLFSYWYGAAHRSPPPPDTTVTTVTKTPDAGQ